jgi:hypothetical protein
VIVQVDREGHRPDIATTLAKSAALMIAEEPFCVPWIAGVEQIQQGDFGCPLWLVDSSSVVPSVLVPKQSCHRAYVYENTTRQMHEAYISCLWEDAPLPVAKLSQDMNIELMNLRDADLTSLVAEMDVDHTVKPVSHTIGGSSHGYARWLSWLEAGGLKAYAQRRNESLDIHGVSRMSAYLNAGMVSPMRLAYETSIAKGAGKSKFLNEFLTWRGLAYAWCYHFPMSSSGCTMEQLPNWASDTLKKHASDPRTVLSRERLANACSGNRAWDGMQRYLVETGELHNNARMGWGCAIPAWTASPEDALRMLIDLNNTFALDGHSPPSYAGLLGCLGLFSGPKRESPVFGKVSARSPKAKYAALAAQISVLSAADATSVIVESALPRSMSKLETNSPTNEQAKVTSRPKGKGKGQGKGPSGRRTIPESFGWRKVSVTDRENDMQSTSQNKQAVIESDVLPRKRRWVSLKAGSEQGELITID